LYDNTPSVSRINSPSRNTVRILRINDIMASRFSITEVLDTLLDDGFSNGESDDDEGEEIYAYLGEPVLRRSKLEAESPHEPMVDDC